MGHDINEVQIPNYTLHLDSSVHNPDLNTARVVVYTHDSLGDLDGDVISTIWLDCGLPGQKSFLLCAGLQTVAASWTVR